ncbi:MAG: DNA polymerase III subunit delta' [Rhizobiales bacterium]|nr:DNA polymerase III subunit delta' [Hyphomicrobiales bacterium]
MISDPVEGDRLLGAPHPRERFDFFGHADAEAELLAAWQAERLPHAILLGGPQGIGKATLAYRFTRFVLSGGNSTARDLSVAADHPTSRQVASLSHPDLLVLRRVKEEDKKAISQVIRVEDTRRITSFFGSTSAYGGWRVCIVDAVEEMNAASANAILKLLEEPPARSLFLLISHTPGRLLPTIRSRCRRLAMKALAPGEVAQALASLSQSIPELDQAQFASAAEASQGSVGRALSLLFGGEDGLEVMHLTRELLARLPAVESASIAALGDKLRGDNLGVFAEAVEDWLADAATGDGPAERLARFAEAWDKVRRATATAEIYNLDRKPLVFQVFTMLSEAARG